MATRSSRSHGSLCSFVATSLDSGSAFYRIYVQRYEFDICPFFVGSVVSGGNYLAECPGFPYHRLRYNLVRQVIVYILLVILAVFAAAEAKILLKKGALKEYVPLWRQYVNPWVIGGYTIMGLSLLLNVFCMGHGVQAKEVCTIESLSYLFVPCLSCLFFKEEITWRKAGAIAVIMIGIVVFFIK